jgi:HEAT repeat protein
MGYEDQVVLRMITLLDSKDLALVKTAIGTLRRYPGSKSKTLPLLDKKVPGPDYNVIQFASYAIKALALDHFEEVTVPQLINNLVSPDPDVIIASLQALDSYHPPDQRVIDKAWPLLKHPDEFVRVKAIRHLAEWVNDDASGKHRRTECLNLCISLLDDPEEEVRLSAAHGLMSWGSDARKALAKLELLYRQTVSRSAATSEEYRGVVFRLDPELAFELQKPQRKP